MEEENTWVKQEESEEKDNSGSENPDEKSEKSVLKSTKKTKTLNLKYVENLEGPVSIYLTSFENESLRKLDVGKLEISFPKLVRDNVTETKYGLIVSFAEKSEAQEILNLNLAKIFGKPVHVVVIPLNSDEFKKVLSFKDIPWIIRNEELEICLKDQGIGFQKLVREKSTVNIEVSDLLSYERLKKEGINFYNSVIFKASKKRTANEDNCKDDIIQCYRCQGFWHMADTCKQHVRCVRCGEEHRVEQCNRPKHNPFCCNCKGPHHAAYKKCPVKQKLKNSVRVQFTFQLDH